MNQDLKEFYRKPVAIELAKASSTLEKWSKKDYMKSDMEKAMAIIEDVQRIWEHAAGIMAQFEAVTAIQERVLKVKEQNDLAESQKLMGKHYGIKKGDSLDLIHQKIEDKIQKDGDNIPTISARKAGQ